MEFEIRYDAERDVVLAAVKGSVRQEHLPGGMKELVDALSGNDCLRAIIDVRSADLKLSITDLYEMRALADGTGMDPRCRRAVIVSGGQEELAFFETVSQNRGQMLRMFADIESAERWLGIDSCSVD